MSSNNVRFCAACAPPLTSREGAAICSECGRTYHLECWRRRGSCAVCGSTDRPHFQPPPVNATVQCPYCDNLLPPARSYCESCGREMRSDESS